MRTILIILCFLVINEPVNSQNFEWARHFTGTSQVIPISFTIDLYGNSYSTGYFTGTADFDPGPDTLNFTTPGMYLLKIDYNGNLVWAKVFDSHQSYAFGIGVNDSGSVFLTGRITGSIDFDPDTGVFILTGNNNIFVAKYDSNGTFQWAKGMGDYGYDIGRSIAIDQNSNVYITGEFIHTVDFDPGPAVFNLTSTQKDAFICKFNSDGDFLWVKQIGGIYDDHAYAICLDNSGNVITSGIFTHTVDFDPGPAVYNLSTPATALYIQKLDSNGNFIWAKHRQLSYNGSTRALAVDSNDNIYHIGDFTGTIDFDPGPGIFNLTSLSQSPGTNTSITKLDAAGDFVWAKRLGGPGGLNSYDIVTDMNQNLYVTGVFGGVTDFDPGVGSLILSPDPLSNNSDMFIVKLTGAGLFEWALNIGGPYGGYGRKIKVDTNNNVYSFGQFLKNADFDHGSGIYNLFTNQTGTYILKLKQCNQPIINASSTNIQSCYGDTGSAFVSVVSGNSPFTYLWSNGDTSTGIIDTAGNYSVTVTDGTGCTAWAFVSISQPFQLQSNISATVTNFNTPGCNGSIVVVPTGGTAPYNIQWNSGSTTNLCEGWYYVTITDANGCVNFDSIYVNYECIPPTLAINAPSTAICFGQSSTATVNISGGIAPYNILWSTGDTSTSIIVIPGTYSVTVTDSISCTGTAFRTFIQAPALITNATPYPDYNGPPNCIGGIMAFPSGGYPPYIISYSSGINSYLCEGWYTATVTDANGCAETDSVYVNFVTGIEELNAAGISIYPNPVNDILTINSQKEIGEIKIYDVVGKLIYQELIKNKNAEINVKEFDSGIYFIEIYGAVGKFVKE